MNVPLRVNPRHHLPRNGNFGANANAFRAEKFVFDNSSRIIESQRRCAF